MPGTSGSTTTGTSIAVLVLGVAMAVLLTGVIAIPLLSGSQDCTSPTTGQDVSTTVAGAPVSVTGPLPEAVGRWSGAQLQNAAAVISAGKALGISAHGQVIGVMTAMGESSLIVVDHGDTAGPDSRGLFQQRANGAWGSYADRMNPTISASNFFKALTHVPGWSTLSPTAAAHQTQHNADPNYYAQFYPDAVRVTAALTGHVDAASSFSLTAGAASPPGTTEECGTAFLTGGGRVVFPLPAGSGYRDNHNWHSSGSHWGSWHTGDDFSVPCGTPVVAVHAGKVHLDTSTSWAGRWLVKVSSGEDAVTTWYAHMRAVTVGDGDYVTPGDQIGEVGDLGNATGCHLHLEVHTKNGSIYGPDNVDPSRWLATHVGRTIGISPAAATGTGTGTAGTPGTTGVDSGAAGSPGSAVGDVAGAGVSGSQADGGFRLATFNILGDNHTGRGADQHPTWPDGARRMPATVSALNKWGVDVAGLQEVQPTQRAAFDRASGGGYQQYPRAGRGGDNRIIWRTSTFELVSAATFTIPYFDGHPTAMPVVRLRQRATGKTAWFINVHNPAETARFHHQGGYRDRAVARERAAARELLRTGSPVFLTGDLNDRGDAFCPLAAGNLFRSASGGSHTSGVCRVPAHAQIDWIFATGTAGFTGYRTDVNPQRTHTSDHPLVVSIAHIN